MILSTCLEIVRLVIFQRKIQAASCGEMKQKTNSCVEKEVFFVHCGRYLLLGL